MALLGRFAAAHADDAQTIRARLLADQPARASRTARTLQRVAAGLGLAEVERSASELEAAIERGETLPSLGPRLDDVAAQLAQLVAGLAEAGVEPGPDRKTIAS